ncbi:Cadherin-23 [Sarracenia purpurea var. burkii]
METSSPKVCFLLVDDVNDNEPVFKPYASSISRQRRQFTWNIGQLSKPQMPTKGLMDREKTGTAAILIKVQDVEDQPPEFVMVTPVTRVSEDAPVGSSVLQDRGVNNKIAYSITSGAQDVFGIDQYSGVISTLKTLDRESPATNNGAYIVQITAREESQILFSNPTVQTEITIIVTDVNDETPTFRSARYVGEINENAQGNTPVTFIGTAIPQGNNGTFRMYIEGDGGIFDVTPHKGINEASFLIRVKDSAKLDYEQTKGKCAENAATGTTVGLGRGYRSRFYVYMDPKEFGILHWGQFS